MIELARPNEGDRVRAYVQHNAGVPTPKGPTQVLGFVEGKTREIAGGWMFERYTGVGGSIHVHMAGRKGRWMTRSVLTMCAIYIFDQLGCDTLFAEVDSTDTFVRQLDERLGFVEHAVLQGYFPDRDLIIYSLSKQDCRWLPDAFKEELNGQEEQAAPGT